MDLRHIELHDLLCEALIALEAGNYPAAAAALSKALLQVEADWLTTPSDLPAPRVAPAPAPDDADDEE